MSIHLDRPDADDPAVRCPRDGAEMRKFNIGGITVDRCRDCAGIWLDLGEMNALMSLDGNAKREITKLDHGAGVAYADADHAVRHCPRDTNRLTPVKDPRQPHVEYDRCTHCGGVFFDSGELADLTEFTLRERLKWLLGSS